MAWQTPKTNWQAADVVSKDDFNRIEGNIQELQDTKETSAGAQAKAEAAARAVQSALNSHKAAAAPHSGHETPAGAQAKAAAAAGAVQAELDAHLSEIATQENLGHVKVDGETITASNGIISAQTQIEDIVTGDKWKWGMEDGIVFLERVVV
jgi:type II secretory pathway component HofQ